MIKNKTVLAEEFISNSPNFWDDTRIEDIDAKHKGILNEFSKINSVSSSLGNRQWIMQNDLGSDAQFIRGKGFFNGIVRPIYRKIFRRFEEASVRNSILDDIEILKLIGADEILKNNPVHLTPGVTDYSFHNGFSVNVRWLRYIYLAHRILHNDLIQDKAWIDIGSFYGGLQGLVHRYKPGSTKVLVDFHHQLLRSYVYLKTLFPHAQHILPEELGQQRFEKSPVKGSFIYCPVTKVENLSFLQADLVTNFFSFGEMTRPMFEKYIKSQFMRKAKNHYFVNRFVSAPFFEPTYDTDLTVIDYLKDREIKYFDVFPMHHYKLIKRDILGRSFHRNTSSSYFEMIS